jgi:hypothetical protein
MTKHVHSNRLTIPVAGLHAYSVDSKGEVWKKNGAARGRDKSLTAMAFAPAVHSWTGDKNLIDKAPWPWLPGIWQLRDRSEVSRDREWTSTTMLIDYLRQHAFGGARTHPGWWPNWSDLATRTAAELTDERRKYWYSIAPPSDLTLSPAAESLRLMFDNIDKKHRPQNHFAFLIFGPLAFAAIHETATIATNGCSD